RAEERLARLGFLGELRVSGDRFDRPGKAADEVGHQAALFFGQICPWGSVIGLAQRSGLRAARLGEPALMGTRCFDEVAERGEFELPAKASEAPAAQPGHAPSNVRSASAGPHKPDDAGGGRLYTLMRDDRIVGDRVDLTGTE